MFTIVSTKGKTIGSYKTKKEAEDKCIRLNMSNDLDTFRVEKATSIDKEILDECTLTTGAKSGRNVRLMVHISIKTQNEDGTDDVVESSYDLVSDDALKVLTEVARMAGWPKVKK